MNTAERVNLVDLLGLVDLIVVIVELVLLTVEETREMIATMNHHQIRRQSSNRISFISSYLSIQYDGNNH